MPYWLKLVLVAWLVIVVPVFLWVTKRLQRARRETSAPVSAFGDVIILLDPRKILRNLQ